MTRTIDAPPASVVEVVTDTSAYGAWNPFMPELTGDLRKGRRLQVRIVPPGGCGTTSRLTVTAAEEGGSWPGRVGWGCRPARRRALVHLTPRRAGTGPTQREVFRGLLVPRGARPLRRTEAGFGDGRGAEEPGRRPLRAARGTLTVTAVGA